MRTKNMRVFAENDDSEVVISGMSGRFPNSRNIADLDYHLYNKVFDLCYNRATSYVIRINIQYGRICDNLELKILK